MRPQRLCYLANFMQMRNGVTMKKLLSLSLFVLVFAVGQATPLAQAVPKNTNERLVIDFYNLAFNAHKPAEAAQRYIGPTYIQHNPLVPNGASPFVQHFVSFFKAHPASALDMVRVISEGDLVVVHSRFTTGPDDKGQAIIDIFRIADGKIVEHWDVIQQIPDHTANGNTMFSGSQAN